MGRVQGRVAFITGAARGQGRSHAVRLAQEGADIIAVDICAPVRTAPYPLATPDDLAETAKLVENLDRRILIREVDVRDLAGLEQVVADGIAEFGRLDIVCANAGIVDVGPAWELSEERWQEMIDINLSGVWRTTRAAIPRMLELGNGGSVILTSSIAGLGAFINLGHYTAAKHGVVGLMRALAVELAPHGIRCNSVHPTNVDTPMVQNPAAYQAFLGGIPNPTRDDAAAVMVHMSALKVPWIDPVDVSNAVLWLASDEARYVTGTTQVIDAGALMPFKIPHG